MGVTIRQIPPGSGIHYICINLRKRRKAQKIGGKKDAEYIARQIRRDIANGSFKFEDEEQEAPCETLREYWDAQLKILPGEVEPGTVSNYRDNFRLHVGPALGDIPLNRLTRERVKQFVGELIGKGLMKPSIRIITSELCAILNRAIEDGRIVRNSASRLSKFYENAKQNEEPVTPLSREEVPLFLQSVKEHFPYYLPIFITFIHSGLRPGELAALKWEDVDFEKRLITVRAAVKQNGEVGKTKTKKKRNVDMSDLLIDTLKQWNKDQAKRFDGDLPEWVFTSRETSGRIDMKNLYHRAFLGSMKAAHGPLCEGRTENHDCCDGLPRRRLYDLRHTFATLLVMNGESLAYVRDQLGHSSITLTVNVYTHWVPGSNRAAVNKLPGLEVQPSNVRKFKRA